MKMVSIHKKSGKLSGSLMEQLGVITGQRSDVLFLRSMPC